MRVFGTLPQEDLRHVAAAARAIEAEGYDGVAAMENKHDPFLALAVAGAATERLELHTGVAIAFARTPMAVANVGWDLAGSTGGRFVVGLGSQVRAHNERRFSVPWTPPAPRMREFILALRAIWRAWNTGERLDFRGRFYQHTLMTPFFSPQPSPYRPPRVFLGALGDRMCEVAGEVADGVLLHPFTTASYVRDRQIPALERGLAKVQRAREDFEIGISPFVVTGPDDGALDAVRQATRMQIAFYGSTPAYRSVLEHHGWGEAQDELNALSKRGRWTEMADVITDDILDAFAPQAAYDRLPAELAKRYGGLADRMSFFSQWGDDHDRWRGLLDALRAEVAASR